MKAAVKSDKVRLSAATKKLYSQVSEYFQTNMSVAESELDFQDDYQLLVAVMLSAQCTDKRVNLTTPALFAAYPDAVSLSKASFDELFSLIKSVTYPRSKAIHLIEMAKLLCDKHDARVPHDYDALLELPGVGRKTANVVSSILWGEAVIAVDTHVYRVARRIGLSKGMTVFEVELDLESGFPADLHPIAHHWLILHGRYVCTARKPQCEECGLGSICRKNL